MLKIVFMGTPEFSVPILEALIQSYEVMAVVTQPDRYVGRKKTLTYSPVKECALKHGIKVFQPEKIRLDYEDIVALKPDLIVTAAYGQIVGLKLLNAPKYRSINVHASLLPKYRGGAPIHHAIANGDLVTGITIMYMEKAMDAGDILSQVEIPILDTDTTGTMFKKLSFAGRDLLLKTIPLLIEGKIVPQKQDESQVTFAYNIKSEEEELDLTNNANILVNKVRSLNPEPLAYLYLGPNEEDKIKILQAKASKTLKQEPIGKIIKYNKQCFSIATGEATALDIYELQPFGKKAMLASAYINGAMKKYLGGN